MARKAKELTAFSVGRLDKPGLHFVGEVPCLALQVLGTGAKTWILRFTIGGSRRDMGLGGYPGVTLAQAREAAREARAKVRRGIDPIEEQRAIVSALKASIASAVTFEACAENYIKAQEPGWKGDRSAKQWRGSLKNYAFPVMGSLLVRDVDVPHVLAAIEPIWNSKTETATRVRNRIELVLDYAIARKYRAGLNPARWRGHLDKILPNPSKVSKVKHYPALPVGDIGAFMARLRDAVGMGARALEFGILTAARTSEVRGAAWAEFDLRDKAWTIPADRMKGGKEHRVPLSDAALALLDSLPRIAGNELVFPAPRGGQLSDATVAAVIDRANAADAGRWKDPTDGRQVVPHGFRSTFRDWAAERTNYPNEVAEMALAHTIGNKVEAAYRRGELFAKRRLMMEDWAVHCGEVETMGSVIPLHRSA